MMLAQASEPPSWSSTISVLAMCGAGLGLLVNAVMAYFMKVQADSFREQTSLMRQQISTPQQISPQPLIIAMQKEFTTKHEFDAHIAGNKDDHDKIFQKIGGVERGARTSTDQQVEVVRRDLVQVSNQVSGLQVETKMQSTQLNRMEKIISDMPGRIVADIVNSKKQ
jgi:hypothetical protein